jgi:hypothetical protein
MPDAPSSLSGLKEAADAIKASAEAIDAVANTIEKNASRSVILQVNNATSRRLTKLEEHHAHGGFRQPPGFSIEPGQTDLFTSQTTGVATGTEGSVRYGVDGTDAFYNVTWSNPFIGTNGTNSTLDGLNTELLVILHEGASGNTRVPMRYMIGETIAFAPRATDWRFCDKCKALYFAPSIESSDCPAGGHHAHTSASFNFRLRHGAEGLSHQGQWRQCMLCTGLFFDGNSTKGVCAAPVPPRHRPEEAYVLSHSFNVNQPGDATHLPGFRLCIDCMGLFSENTSLLGCPAHDLGQHQRFPDSALLPPQHPLAFLPDKRPFNYRLAHDMVPEPADHQAGWRQCRKCCVVFFEPEIDDSDCPRGGTHEPELGIPVFQMAKVETPAGSGPSQQGWAKCKRCKVMFFNGLSSGRCPVPDAPGTHRHGHRADGLDFQLEHDVAGPGQNQWRFCNKCFSLVFEPQNDQSVCAKGGQHVPQGFNFRLEHD